MHSMRHVNMVNLEVSQIWYLQDYALRSWLVNEENLTVKFPGLLNQFGIVEEDYKTTMIMDLIMKRVQNPYLHDVIMNPKEKTV